MVGLTGPISNHSSLVEKVRKLKTSTSVESNIDLDITDVSYDPNNIINSLKQQQVRLSPGKIEQIVQEYLGGASTYKLAKKYGCHRSTISNNLKKAGINVSIEKIDMDEAIRLYESGWTTKRIAEKYHMTDNSVSRRLKKAGVKMRTRWDYCGREQE